MGNKTGVRKQITFDLSQAKLKEYYPVPKDNANPQYYKKAYDDIYRFMKKQGFKHRQYSVYVSSATLTEAKVISMIQTLASRMPWLSDCVNEIDVTNIGRQHSLTTALAEATEIVKETEQDAEDFNINEKVEIAFNARYVSAIEDKFEPDKLFYTIRLPKGFMLNGEDVSGCTIHPKEVEEVAGDPGKILAVYHKEGDAPVMINLQREGNLIGRINAEDLKAAVDAYGEKAVKQQIEKAAERQSNIESVIQEDKDDEIE